MLVDGRGSSVVLIECGGTYSFCSSMASESIPKRLGLESLWVESVHDDTSMRRWWGNVMAMTWWDQFVKINVLGYELLGDFSEIKSRQF